MDDEQFKECRRKTLNMLKHYNDDLTQLELLTSKLREIIRRTDVGVGAVRYDQPTAGATNKISSVAENVLIAKEREIERLTNEIARLGGSLERIDIALKHLPAHHSQLLRLKYIEHKSWKQIACVLPYSEVYIRQELRDRATDLLTGYLFPELTKVNLFEKG